MGAFHRLTLYNFVCTEFTYVKPFRLKEYSGEGASHLRSPPLLPLSTLLSLVKISGKLKKEFLDNETQSFPYLLDMATTVKVARTLMEQL